MTHVLQHNPGPEHLITFFSQCLGPIQNLSIVLQKSPPCGSTHSGSTLSQPPPALPVWSLFETMNHSATLQLPSITSLSLPLRVIPELLLGGKCFC